MASPITVIKASGETEEFYIKKLVESMMRSGAPEDIAVEIAKNVEHLITPQSTTRQIYRHAKKLLKQYNHVSGMRYALKKAISNLGPSGYPFEKYFARIMTAFGYRTEINRIIDGFCVRHEVDVMAVKGNEHTVVECKYHNDTGKPTDVKVALYVHSRVEDIRRAYKLNESGEILREGWLVTNTRFTTDAIKFSECAGLKIVSWRYPHNRGLERMIEEKHLYPVTVLPSAKKSTLDALFKNNLIIAQEIANMHEEEFVKNSGLDAPTARAIKNEADKLCPCE